MCRKAPTKRRYVVVEGPLGRVDGNGCPRVKKSSVTCRQLSIQKAVHRNRADITAVTAAVCRRFCRFAATDGERGHCKIIHPYCTSGCCHVASCCTRNTLLNGVYLPLSPHWLLCGAMRRDRCQHLGVFARRCFFYWAQYAPQKERVGFEANGYPTVQTGCCLLSFLGGSFCAHVFLACRNSSPWLDSSRHPTYCITLTCSSSRRAVALPAPADRAGLFYVSHG